MRDTSPGQPTQSPPDFSWGPRRPVARPPALRATASSPRSTFTVTGSRFETRIRRAMSRPGAGLSVARLEQLADRHRRVDEADVRVRLREVAEQGPRVRVEI